MVYSKNNPSLERWGQLSLPEQMANIGSEISRAIHWRNKDKIDFSNNAVNRAMDLIYITIDTNTIRSRYKELTRLREMLMDYFFGDNEYSSSDLQWENYFNHFNYLARKKQ